MYVQWVTSYYISYSQDGTNWVDIPTLYSGNVDQYTKKTNNLPPDTVARYVRLRPQGYRGHISLRFDVTGCTVQSKVSSNKRVTVVRHITNPPPPTVTLSTIRYCKTTKTTRVKAQEHVKKLDIDT